MTEPIYLIVCEHCKRSVSKLAYAAHLYRVHSIHPAVPLRFDDEGTLLPCDDCHRTDGSHDWEVEH
jgi:hypothetical protein